MDAKDLSVEIVTKLKNDGIVRPKVYSPEALKVLNAQPINTVWGWDHGRPIYNRLPMVGEAYQKAYESDQAKVYLDPTANTANGPGTLQVLRAERDWRVLDVLGGVITWAEGELTVPRMQVNIASLDSGRGLQDGEYQVGYRLQKTEKEAGDGYEVAYSEDGSMSELQFAYDASGETTLHRKPYGISDKLQDSWWPNDYYGADGYLVGTHYTFDFIEPQDTKSFHLKGDLGKIGAKLAHYVSDDAIIWFKRSQLEPSTTGWEIDAQGPLSRYHRFFFWDGNVSINNITYTGDGLMRDRRVLFPDTEATPFIENLSDTIDGDYILLATFTVKNRVIANVNDLRRVTYEKYQPVADWLTTFGDEQLRCRFDNVVNYNSLFMDPTTADFQFYEEMDDSACWGLGEVSLGLERTVPKIDYPEEVALVVDDVSASMIDWTTYPEEAGDLVTPPYAQTTLQDWSMDNGYYQSASG